MVVRLDVKLLVEMDLFNCSRLKVAVDSGCERYMGAQNGEHEAWEVL